MRSFWASALRACTIKTFFGYVLLSKISLVDLVFVARVTASSRVLLRGRSGLKQQKDSLLTGILDDKREIKTFFGCAG
ncbi:MAG TPA: hypothetical protein VJO34_09370 [Methylomirabilota bacterium]|nr:hypothetical protein [Methylomirabilota bacterium]